MMINKIKIMASITVLLLTPVMAQAAEFTVTQTEKTFKMKGAKVEKLEIKAGDTIKFLNEDPWFHNIFSLSELKTFDLGSYPQGQSKSVTFEKAGSAEVECAIHPQMLLKLEVK